jgi:protein-S-isoprenylcysteine O-methyltransferase Ste14
VEFGAIHPQLCETGGDRFLADFLQAKQPLVIAGCAPKMEYKMFRDAFAEKLMIVLAVACGGGSLLLLAVLSVGSYAWVRMEWPLPGVLLWDGLLCTAFFLQHSGMLRRGFRDRISGVVPRQYHRAIYSIASGVVLTALVMLWQPSDIQVFVVKGPWRLAVYAGALIAIAVFVWGAFAIRALDLFGVSALRAHVQATTEPAPEFVVRGPYRWVRHPWYAAAILLFWSSIDLTADRLLFNVLWTAWVCVGAKLEERDLLIEFGTVYDEYRRHVPMLIPRRRAYRPESPPANPRTGAAAGKRAAINHRRTSNPAGREL